MLFLPFFDNIRVKTQAGIVEKDTAVDFPGIDRNCVSGRDMLYCQVQFQRNAKILGEMIQGAKRQHTQRTARADQN